MHVATADMQMTLRSFIRSAMIFPPFFLFSMMRAHKIVSLSPSLMRIDVRQLGSAADPTHSCRFRDAPLSAALDD